MEDKKNLKDWWAERTKNQKYLIIGGIILLMIIGALTDDKPKKVIAKTPVVHEVIIIKWHIVVGVHLVAKLIKIMKYMGTIAA